MNFSKLTFVTAVYNNEAHISSLYEHLKYFLDNGAKWIVVVDFRSSDNTDKLAKSFGARVLLDKGESSGIVFFNKNRGIENADTPWIFIIDADERMDKKLIKEVSKIVSSKDAEYDVYETGFINIDFGRAFVKSDMKDKTFVRLFRKGSFYYDTSDTSEGFHIQKILGSTKKLDGKLIHNSHPTISEFVRKIDLYSSRESKILVKKYGDKSSLFFLYKMMISPVTEFVRKYLIWQLYKEGIHGFVSSVIFSMYHFMIWSKTYEVWYKEKNKNFIKRLYSKWGF